MTRCAQSLNLLLFNSSMIGLPWDDGLTYDYATEQMVKMLWNLAVIAFILTGILALLLLFKKYVMGKPSIPNPQAMEAQLLPQEPSKQQRHDVFDVFYFTTSVLFYGLLILGTLMIGVIHGFQRLGSTTLAKVMTALVTLLVGILLHVLWKFLNCDNKREFLDRARQISGTRLVVIFISLMLWITFVGIVMFVLNGICYCIYNDNLGSVASNTGLSTSLTRRLFLDKKVCADESICRVYATLPELTNSSVFINAHSGLTVNNLSVVLNQLGGGNGPQLSPRDTHMFVTDFDEVYGKRKVWTFLFTDLQPGTVYNVTLGNEHNKIVSTTYKTISNLNDDVSSLKVIVGGDVGLSEHGRSLFRNIGEINPDLLILGGDIAYDNAMTYCYYAWDNFYSLLDRVNQANNRLVPFIMALGNHDVGRNSFARVQNRVSSRKGPWYFAYNPQHFAEGTTFKIPQIDDRKSYGYHIIGKTILVTLDSRYIETYESQSVYAERISSQFRAQGYSLFGLYHVPIYPSCFHSSHFQSPSALNDSHIYYESVFVKYNYTLCFENHVHKLKRTLPINGVVYIGDGNMGVDEEPCAQVDQMYRDKMAKTMFEGSNHYWLAEWNRSHVGLKAMMINHTIVDETLVRIR